MREYKRRRRTPRWLAALLAAVVLGLLGGVGYQVTVLFEANSRYAAAERAMATGDYGAALAGYENYLRMRPGDGQAHYRAARAARRAGRPDEARAHITSAEAAGWPAEAIRLEVLLTDLRQGGALDRREKLLELSSDPQTPEDDRAAALEELSLSYLRTGDPAKAAESAAAWAEIDPERSAPWRIQGLAHQAEGNTDEATAAFTRAVDADAGDAAAQRGLGQALLDGGKPREAVMHLMAAGDSPATLFALARCRRELGDFERAREVLDRLAKQVRDDARVQEEFGRLELASGNPSAAVDWLRKATATPPYPAESLVYLADALAAAGKPDDAAEVRKRAEELRADLERVKAISDEVGQKPGDAAMRSEGGRLLLKHGRRDEAAEWFNSALAIDPLDPVAAESLADLVQPTDPARAAQLRALADQGRRRKP